MSLEHNFVIAGESDDWMHVSSQFFDNPGAFEHVNVHDDYISYFGDFIQFFDFVNPCRKNEIHNGLCYYGVTLIQNERLDSAIKLLEHFLGIFQLAPENISLTGNYVIEESETPDPVSGFYEKGHFEMLKTTKEKIVKKLEELIALFSKAKQENKCIFHFGI